MASGATTGLLATPLLCTAARAWPLRTRRRSGSWTTTSNGPTWLTSPLAASDTYISLKGVAPHLTPMAHPRRLTTRLLPAKTSDGSSRPTSALTLPRGISAASAWRTSKLWRRNRATGVLPATSSSSGAMSQRTRDSSASTGLTTQRAIHVTTCG